MGAAIVFLSMHYRTVTDTYVHLLLNDRDIFYTDVDKIVGNHELKKEKLTVVTEMDEDDKEDAGRGSCWLACGFVRQVVGPRGLLEVRDPIFPCD